MIGDMQRWTPNVASIIEHAKEFHPTKEVISRMVSGDIHRTIMKRCALDLESLPQL